MSIEIVASICSSGFVRASRTRDNLAGLHASERETPDNLSDPSKFFVCLILLDGDCTFLF